MSSPEHGIPPRLRHTPLEACVTVPLGQDPQAPPLPIQVQDSPRKALEAILGSSLERQPWLVSFSGGRDSSAILALATLVARRHGCADPIPVTNCFPNEAGTDERRWQESVIRHLELNEWLRFKWTDEMDLLGPFGREVLEHHGATFPHNIHFIVPFLQSGKRGTLLTGVGGDELLGGPYRPFAAAFIYQRRLPNRRAWRGLVKELAPLPIRARLAARRDPIHRYGWIRRPVRQELAIRSARDSMAAPIRGDRALQYFWQSRYAQSIIHTMRAVGARYEVDVVSPFMDGGLYAAYARSTGRAGPPSRAEALLALVGDLLPANLLTRRSKARFDEAFWNRYSREYAMRWTGTGVDHDLVDAGELAREWRNGPPAPASSTLFQRAWLAEASRNAQIPALRVQ